MFICLIVAVVIMTLGGWWFACGKALFFFKIDREIVDWSTAIVACGLRQQQYLVLFYTLIAYIWMGVALFVYLACLFLGFIYASFWSKLALVPASLERVPVADPNIPNSPAAYRLYFEPSLFAKYAGQFLITYFIACTFGLFAGYFMRFESQYLLSADTNIRDYFFNYYGLFAISFAPTSGGDLFQRHDASNQTLYLSLTVTAATVVSFAATTGMLLSCFYNAKRFTLDMASRLQSFGGNTAAITFDRNDVLSVKNVGFFSSTLPDWPAMAIVLSTVTLSTFVTQSSMATFLGGTVLAALAVAGRHAFSTGRESATSSRIGDSIATQVELEKIVRNESIFVSVLQFEKAFGLLKDAVCAIELPGGGGTGFLVGDDLVLTNYHVIEDIYKGNISPADLSCRFDYFVPVGPDGALPGRVVRLADENNWLLFHRPYSQADITPSEQWLPHELDYALLRLKEKVGSQPRNDKQAPAVPRGWVSLLDVPPAVEAHTTLLLVQHPREDKEDRLRPMQLAIGSVLCFVGNGQRLRHDTRTLPGSSGSPCCNADLKLVGLHHAGDPIDWPDFHGRFNQAIPIILVIQDLQATDALKDSGIWSAPPCPSTAATSTKSAQG
jgi:hypothetical protein